MDYFLRPKPAYFAIARELRPFAVGMTRKEHQTFPDDLSAAKFTIESILEIWGTNSTLEDKKATLEVTSYDLQSEWKDSWKEYVQFLLQPPFPILSTSVIGQSHWLQTQALSFSRVKFLDNPRERKRAK